MKANLIRTVMLCMISMLVACTAPGPVPPTKLEPVSEFLWDSRPVASAQDSLRNVMRAGGIVTLDDEEAMYSDTAFFPIIERDFQLFDPQVFRPRHSTATEPDFSGIDFDSHFAFLVAHPAPGGMSTSGHTMPIYMSDTSVSYLEDTVILHIDGSRLGTSTLSNAEMLHVQWEARIYKVERRGRSKLEVRLYDDHFQYSLLPAAAADTPDENTQAAPAEANSAADTDSRP